MTLGHASADVTQVYAERDLTLARKVAAGLGHRTTLLPGAADPRIGRLLLPERFTPRRGLAGPAERWSDGHAGGAGRGAGSDTPCLNDVVEALSKAQVHLCHWTTPAPGGVGFGNRSSSNRASPHFEKMEASTFAGRRLLCQQKFSTK